MNAIAKIIRFCTVPPVLAFVLATSLFLHKPPIIGGIAQYCAMLVALSILPVLAYPLQPLFPKYREKGREGQRELAFVASVVGYACGVIFAIVTAAPASVHIIYWTYLVSVILLTVFNSATPWRASGHACGVAGPITAMLYFIGLKVWPMIFVFGLMAWASLQMKRHTLPELILGGLDSVVAFALVLFAAQLFT